MTGSLKNLSRLAGNWDPATFRSTCFPDVPSSSLGAVVGAAASTVDPDVTPEDRALQVRHHLSAAQPVLQPLMVGTGVFARCPGFVPGLGRSPSFSFTSLMHFQLCTRCLATHHPLLMQQQLGCCCNTAVSTGIFNRDGAHQPGGMHCLL